MALGPLSEWPVLKQLRDRDARAFGTAAFSKRSLELTPRTARDGAREVKSARSRGGKADGEGEVLAKIAKMKPADRAMAERVHALVKAAARHRIATSSRAGPAPGRSGRARRTVPPRRRAP